MSERERIKMKNYKIQKIGSIKSTHSNNSSLISCVLNSLTNEDYATIVKFTGEFSTGRELLFMMSPILVDMHFMKKMIIFDFSDFKYDGGDRFFDWYFELLETPRYMPLFKDRDIVIIVSSLCKDAILSLIEYYEIDELKNVCFDTLEALHLKYPNTTNFITGDIK